jgi:formylglycine-generating enzyme required for sulfatase activity
MNTRMKTTTKAIQIGFAALVLICFRFLPVANGAPEPASVSGTNNTADTEEENAKSAAVAIVQIGQATKQHPFENSLGMKFVRVPGTKVLFSIWETRARDFRAYAEATGYRQQVGMYVMKVVMAENGPQTKWELNKEASWEEPGFTQSAEHPVVGVSWDEAKAFCAWLTEKERKEGKIGASQEYRLPTDEEWSAAVGDSRYPWGNKWPPPKNAGNYFDEAAAASLPGKAWPHVSGNDGYARTSPVGTFTANRYGLYDMGGNVWQWCEDWYRKEMNSDELLKKFAFLNEDGGGNKYRVLRGAAWSDSAGGVLLSSYRDFAKPDFHHANYGFRCVFAGGLR